MARSDPNSHGEEGFATALAMTFCLALSMALVALLVQSETNLIAARHRLERSSADYQLDAIQMIAAREFQQATDSLKAHRVAFDAVSANVVSEQEAAKLAPSSAASLPDSWLAAMGVQAPPALKKQLSGLGLGRPLTLQALADLDPSPLWKACAAEAISANGSKPGVAKMLSSGQAASSGLMQTLRLTAWGDDGWVDDRVVRLTTDQADPVIVLDRRLYRRSGPPLVCPPPPELQETS